MLEKSIKSINDLTKKIDALHEEYSMGEFAKSFKRRLARRKIDFWNSMNENKGLVNPVISILKAKNSLSDEEMMKVLNILEDLKKKYKYDEYMQRCDEVREMFLLERADYFASTMKQVLSDPEGNNPFNPLQDMLGASDNMFCTWLEDILRKIRPETLSVDYEDVDGHIKNANICFEPVRVTEDYVSAPLIDRYTGNSQFDSFLLRSFFDADEKEWVYIPVRFIISVKSANSQINSETM